MENYYQDLMFVLAPKADYNPTIDPVENSNALKSSAKSLIGWELHEFDLTKHISLRIDSIYLVILRVYGRAMGSNESSGKQKQYLTLACPQDDLLITKTWHCLNGDVIHAENVCDAQPHCADSSDEDPTLCKGDQNDFYEGLNYFITAIMLLGFVSYLVALILTSMKLILFEKSGESDSIDLTGEVKETFKAMREACSTIDISTENEDKENKMNKMSPKSIKSLKTVYRRAHRKGPSQQTVFFETIHDFSMHPSYNEACSNLVDHIAKQEEDIHRKDQKRPNCIKRFLQMDLEVATYYFNVFERNGFFSRLMKKIVSIPKSIFGTKFEHVAFQASIITTIGFAIKSIVTQYLDMVFDMKMFTSLQHVFNNFIGDKEKLVRMSNLPINEMSYAYLALGLLSKLSYYIIFVIDFKHIFRIRDSSMQKIYFGLSVCFPLHFVTLEFAKTLVLQMKMRNNFRISLEDSIETKYDVDNAAEEYAKYKRKIKENTSRMMSIRNTWIKMLVVETLVENLPQLSIVITFMISELSLNNGKLLMIVKDGLVSFAGGSFEFLCILVIFLQYNKLGFSLNKIQSRTDFPFDSGIVGSLMISASTTIMIGAKVLLFSTVLSHATVFYPVCMLLEMIIAAIYFKAIGVRLDTTKNILPCMISPIFLSIKNENHNAGIENEKLKLLSVVSLHILNLVFAYSPIYAVTQFLENLKAYESSYSLPFHGISTLTYLAAVGLYLALNVIFNNYGNPWRYLQEAPHEIEPRLDGQCGWTSNLTDGTCQQSKVIVRNSESIKTKSI